MKDFLKYLEANQTKFDRLLTVMQQEVQASESNTKIQHYISLSDIDAEGINFQINSFGPYGWYEQTNLKRNWKELNELFS